MQRTTGQKVRRWFGAVAGASLLVTAAGGFLHTKAGRPWMARIFGASCPMNSATAADVDKARHAAVATSRGSEPAPARPAFGFQLDVTSVAEVMAWAKREGVRCEQDKAWLVKCAEVAAPALGRPESEGRIEELAMGFSAQGKLVNITTLRRHLSPEDGSRVMRNIAATLYKELGSPSSLSAELPQNNVSSEALSSMSMEVKYRDYLAEVTAMNLPQSGVAVREHYLSAND